MHTTVVERTQPLVDDMGPIQVLEEHVAVLMDELGSIPNHKEHAVSRATRHAGLVASENARSQKGVGGLAPSR